MLTMKTMQVTIIVCKDRLEIFVSLQPHSLKRNLSLFSREFIYVLMSLPECLSET